jgi:hypothetical protein
VLAAGSATIVHDGEIHDVDRPELQPIEAVTPFISDKNPRLHRPFNVEQCVTNRRAGS